MFYKFTDGDVCACLLYLMSYTPVYFYVSCYVYLSFNCILSYSYDCFVHAVNSLKAALISDICLTNSFMHVAQFHKCHNASVPYPTMHHFGTEMCTFLFQCGAFWDMRQVHCGIFETALLV